MTMIKFKHDLFQACLYAVDAANLEYKEKAKNTQFFRNKIKKFILLELNSNLKENYHIEVGCNDSHNPKNSKTKGIKGSLFIKHEKGDFHCTWSILPTKVTATTKK